MCLIYTDALTIYRKQIVVKSLRSGSGLGPEAWRTRGASVVHPAPEGRDVAGTRVGVRVDRGARDASAVHPAPEGRDVADTRVGVRVDWGVAT